MIYVGIDPGKSGAVAMVQGWDQKLTIEKMPGEVFSISELFRKIKAGAEANGEKIRAVLEKVHSMPGDGSVQAFAFGQNVGQLEGVLATLGIPVAEAVPQRWMRYIPGMPVPKHEKGVKKTQAQKVAEKKARKEYIHEWVQKRHGRSIFLYAADAVAIATVAPMIWGAENGN